MTRSLMTRFGARSITADATQPRTLGLECVQLCGNVWSGKIGARDDSRDGASAGIGHRLHPLGLADCVVTHCLNVHRLCDWQSRGVRSILFRQIRRRTERAEEGVEGVGRRVEEVVVSVDDLADGGH